MFLDQGYSMATAVIDAVISLAASFGLGGVVGGGVAYLLLKSFLPK